MGSLGQAVSSLAQNLADAARVMNTTAIELPRVYVDTTVQVLGGTTTHVPAGGSLQAALDAAGPGDTITLEAGATYTGRFELGVKTNWVYVKTLNFNVAAGTRVTQNDEPTMATIQCPTNGGPALQALVNTKYWRFIGINFVNPNVNVYFTNIINLQPLTTPASTSEMPSYIIFDRCSIHGNPGATVRRGIRFGGAHQAVIDSIIYDIRQAGFDSQAVSDSQGSGPYKIYNCYLEAASENVGFGGSNPWFTDVYPSDIEIKRNHLYKPMWWQNIGPDANGLVPLIKNLIEFKHGKRAIIEGNIFENNWMAAQPGFAVVMTPVYQTRATGYNMEDILYRNNRFLNTANWINHLGNGITANGGRASQRRIAYINNYVELNGNFRTLQIVNTATDVVIAFNTIQHTAFPASGQTALMIGQNPGSNVELKYNVIPAYSYGVYTNAIVTTQTQWDAAFLPTSSVDQRIVGNILYGPGSKFVSSVNSYLASYAAAIAVNTAGADLAAIQAAINGVAAGTVVLPPGNPPGTPPPTVPPTVPPTTPPTQTPNPAPTLPVTLLIPYSRDWIIARIMQEIQ